MKKIDSHYVRWTQKRALREVREEKRAAAKMPRRDQIIMVIHHQMDELLHADAFVYRDLEKHKHVRQPRIRPLSHKMRGR